MVLYSLTTGTVGCLVGSRVVYGNLSVRRPRSCCSLSVYPLGLDHFLHLCHFRPELAGLLGKGFDEVFVCLRLARLCFFLFLHRFHQ